ncbi:MAG: helix-turn-helix domain-containing protein [Psychrosphaera sp.]|nr:helix-turn-helix domain-containing protein [Psychrosphaera sp.]
MKLGEKIKQLRTDTQLTQPELAEAAGIEQSYLSKVENDKGSPSFDIISRLAKALGTSAGQLLESLDQDYVEQRLGHLPEVAVQFTEIKLKQQAIIKRKFVFAVLAIMIGLGCFLVGQTKILYPSMVYNYESKGVILEGESVYHFRNRQNHGELREQWYKRINESAPRVDIEFVVAEGYRGEHYVIDVETGRRLFTLEKAVEREHYMNSIITIIGLLLMAMGGLAFAYIKKFSIK